MTMGDLRALVNTSRTAMYIHEEIEIPHHSIGFLLEGCIRNQVAAQELITSPAVLLPTYGTQNSQNLETSGPRASSFTYHGSQYIADSRARVIVLNMAAHEVESAIQRRKSSFLLLNSADHPPRSRSREHIGLMSRPELAYNQTQHNWNSEYTGSGTKNMSAKAMQLSIFGCMVFDHPDPRNVPPRIRDKPSHSKSYPRVPSNQAPPLMSVQSEGSSTLRNLTVRSFAGQNTAHPSQGPGTQFIPDHSSDESGGEGEHITCIDSPSNISFHQAS